MSDERLRGLERTWREADDPLDYLINAQRSGIPLEEVLNKTRGQALSVILKHQDQLHSYAQQAALAAQSFIALAKEIAQGAVDQTLLARTFARLNQFESAEQLLDQDDGPLRHNTLRFFAEAAAKQKYYMQAAAYAQQAGDSLESAHRAIARIAAENQDYDIAERYAQRSADPHSTTLSCLAAAAAKNKDYPRAEAYARRSGERIHSAFGAIAVAAAQNQDYDRAEAYAEQSRYARDDAYATMAGIAAGWKDYAKAEAYARQACGKRREAYGTMACAAAKNQDYALALGFATRQRSETWFKVMARNAAENLDHEQASAFARRAEMQPYELEQSAAIGSLKRGLFQHAREHAERSNLPLETFCALAEILHGVRQ